MSKRISVIIVDDHLMFREVLAQQLRAEPDLDVLATRGEADGVLEEVLRLSPDVVLFDIDMPGLSCFEAAGKIRSCTEATAIIFLSAFKQDHYIERALKVGAAGYLVKTESMGCVLGAIRAAASGRTYYSPEVQSRLIAGTDGMHLSRQAMTRVSALSDRETEVLRYIARGMSEKDMGKIMKVSVNTVHTHTVKLMDKLDIHNRIELAKFAIREGIAES